MIDDGKAYKEVRSDYSLSMKTLFYFSLQDLILISGLEFTSHRTIFLYYFILIYYLFIVFIFGLEIY